MIRVYDITKTYKNSKQIALQDFSFDFCEDEITGLLGVNGAGKSTLLNILALRLFPDCNQKYSLEIDGTETANLTDTKIASLKEKIAFVSENAQFYGELKVCELLRNTVEFYGSQANYDELVKKCSLTEVLSKKIKTLSKGYRQRLSFALALSSNPKIIILDEPVSGLDPIQINEIRNLIKSLKKGRIIILSTHIMQEVESLCDKILIIHDGKLITSGSENEILEKTKCKTMEQAFLSLTNGNTEGGQNE